MEQYLLETRSHRYTKLAMISEPVEIYRLQGSIEIINQLILDLTEAKQTLKGE